MSRRDDMIEIFTKAYDDKRKEIGRGIAPPGTKVGAGIDALAEAGYLNTKEPTDGYEI
jgi:hypothetical protein